MNTENKNTWGYELREFDQTETQNFLRSVLRQDTCVPFLGAGFTRGERARSANVPGGGEWMDLMREQIKAAAVTDKPSDEELAKFTFQELSDIYFRENIVSLDVIKASVNTCFTKVDIADEAKKKFLSIDWPYIYTLNIDDGIERAIDGIKVLPYRDFSRHSDRRYVYKLHGDADDVLTAATRVDLRVIFGKADYIKSLNKNQYLISSLATDFCEKNVIFIGCSLTDELDISFALASISPDEKGGKTARIFVTSSAPKDYAERMKLKSYGITDVIVTDYFAFYNFAVAVAEQQERQALAIDAFTYRDDSQPNSNQRFVSYLLQSGWKYGENPYSSSVRRTAEATIKDKLGDPLVVIWGRRFSGRSTVLHRILSEARTRRRFFVPSMVSMSDRAFNEILSVQDSLIAIDSGAVHFTQLRTLAQNADRLADNNTTVLLAVSRSDLSALGSGYSDDAVRIDSKLQQSEVAELNKLLDPLGFQRWNSFESILDNVFTLGSSPIAMGILNNQSKLDERIDVICADGKSGSRVPLPSKLEFSLLFYLAVRQRVYSFVHRTFAKNYGLAYVADTHSAEFAKKWSPFIELEETDAVSRKAANSSSVLICNSYAWTQLAVRRLSNRLGFAETTSFIVDLFTSVRAVDSEAFELILFDNLNSVYSTRRQNERDWGAKVITTVYEKLAPYCAQDPDYWLQRAKGIYYLSNNESELRIAVEYCEKGIVEKAARTGINAKLTKANLLGKLCDVTGYRDDDDLARAISAYVDAIAHRHVNPTHIDELLRKNQHGKGYMNKVCEAASTRAALLPKRHDIRSIEEYAKR